MQAMSPWKQEIVQKNGVRCNGPFKYVRVKNGPFSLVALQGQQLSELTNLTMLNQQLVLRVLEV